MEANETTLTDEDRYSVFEMLRKLTPEHELLELAPLGPTAVYTTLVTLWMLTMQRLGGGSSLTEVVKVVLNYGNNLLPDNKRVRDGTLSNASGAYSKARKRLPIEAAELLATGAIHSAPEKRGENFEKDKPTRLMFELAKIDLFKSGVPGAFCWLPGRQSTEGTPPCRMLRESTDIWQSLFG